MHDIRRVDVLKTAEEIVHDQDHVVFGELSLMPEPH